MINQIKNFIVFAGVYMAAAAQGGGFIPADDVLTYLFQHLDLTTFRNSTAPQRQSGQRHFAELGYEISDITDDTLLIETAEWRYTIKIISRRDVNKDGSEDLEICFTDQAKAGTYHSQKPLLLTQFSADGDLVALKFAVQGCEAFIR